MIAIIAAAALQVVVADAVADRHAACLSAISVNAETAYEDALTWRHQGGGWPAEHCVSLALIALDQAEYGASRLRAAAEGAVIATDLSRAIMFGQAGDGFLIAQAYDQAYAAFSRGLDFAPGDSGLHRGAAQAALATGDLGAAAREASAALNAADAMDDRLEALRVRAEARLQSGELDAAEADMTAAREIAPDDIDLLLLRGRINEARRGADWRQPG
jgi:tetratricopeptide (TPR) repeat protein